jgi:origin recognition complex subunit 2
MSEGRNLRRSTRMSTYLDESELNSTAEEEITPAQKSTTPSSKQSLESIEVRRRSGRKPIPTKKILESKNNAVKKINRKLDELSISLSEESNDDDDDELERETVRAQALFHEDDVEGQNMYTFKTPKKKQAMALLATNTPKSAHKHSPPRTPKTPKTPKSRKSLLMAKTPHRDREKLKQSIAKKVVMDDSDDDFSASESDFEPSGSSSSSDHSSTSEEEQPAVSPPHRKTVATPSTSAASIAFGARRSTRRTANKNLDYVLESDAYFTTHSSAKSLTSNHTLDRLKNPRLSQDRLFGLLAELKLSNEHEQAIKQLHEEYFSFFPKWMLLLNEGFSVLLHGIGSKRGILTEFREQMLKNQTVVVINGFFPSLTIKDVLDAITKDVLETTITNSNYHEVVDEIDVEFQAQPDLHLFLIVHNIDGVMLRNNKAQHILSRLAKVKNIHLLASIDHINTPLCECAGERRN